MYICIYVYLYVCIYVYTYYIFEAINLIPLHSSYLVRAKLNPIE